MNAFEAFLLVVAFERLLELLISKRHERALVRAGQMVVVERLFALMVFVHAGVLVFAAGEARLLDRAFHPWLGGLALAVFASATALRWWAIRSLGEQWTVRVVAGPALELKAGGPFRYLRHPNYLGVACEVIAIPLIGGAYVTAAVFGLLNAFVLLRRIRLEESTLAGFAPYYKTLGGRRALVPRFRGEA